MRPDIHTYRANGLTIASEIELPELTPHDGAADVMIRVGEVPERLDGDYFEGARYQAKPAEYLLDVPGVARYWVRNGREVVLAPATGAAECDLRVFILSSVMGALAHQNGFLPLHASAIAVNGTSVLFAGDSGCGKSTLAAAFHERGLPLVADDLCAVSLAEIGGGPVLHPGYRNVKLWADALEHVGSALGERHRVRTGLQKYSVRVPGDAPPHPLPIRKIFVLTTELANDVQLSRIRGRAKMAALRSETYRYRLLHGFRSRDRHFRIAQAIARNTEMVLVRRPLFLAALDDLLDRLEGNLDVPFAEPA